MRKFSKITGLSDTLSNVLGKYHLDKRLKQESAIAAWAEVVGEKCAQASRPETVRDGILFVSCKSGAWAQELTFLKEHILGELARRVGKGVITDIRFAGSGLRKLSGGTSTEEEERPSPKEIQAIELGKAELGRISKAVDEVKDPEMAVRMRKAMETAQKLEHWKLEHGWCKCRKCGDLFKGTGTKCGGCG